LNTNPELETQLEKILSEAGKKKPATIEEDFFDSLYPSIAQMRQEKIESNTPPSWDEDPRTLESSFYPSMRRKPE
jgi:hypothetical protein